MPCELCGRDFHLFNGGIALCYWCAETITRWINLRAKKQAASLR